MIYLENLKNPMKIRKIFINMLDFKINLDCKVNLKNKLFANKNKY